MLARSLKITEFKQTITNFKIIKIMSSKRAFFILLAGIKFAANANVTKLLKKGSATDAELAIAVKTTKQYKENKDLQTEVAKVIATTTAPVAEKKEEPVKPTTGRGAEPRRY
jgi:hypothetical protein